MHLELEGWEYTTDMDREALHSIGQMRGEEEFKLCGATTGPHNS